MQRYRVLLAVAVLNLVVLGVSAQDKSASAGPLRAGSDGVGVPSCLKCFKPQYSAQARKAKFEGDVGLSAVIGLNGRATKLKVLHSPGFGLDKKAIAAVHGWRFKPALGPDGKPVAVSTTIDVHFGLADDRPAQRS